MAFSSLVGRKKSVQRRPTSHAQNSAKTRLFGDVICAQNPHFLRLILAVKAPSIGRCFHQSAAD